MSFFSPNLDVFLFSLTVVLVINVFYKLLVKQGEAKGIKERIKELNAKIKELKANKQQVDELFKDVMRENSKLMRLSFKPMIISFIIVIISLPWLGTIYGERSVEIKDGNGEMLFNGNSYAVSRNATAVSLGGETCELPCRLKAGQHSFNLEASGNNVKVSPVIAHLPFSLPVVGNDLGWLGWYFLLSLLFMVVSRRFMKIYV